MSSTKETLRAGIIFPRGRLTGCVSGVGHLVGECKIGNVPSGQFITKDDISEHGSFIRCVDGKLVIEDLTPAENQAY